jgi:hypothetical protein
MEENDKTEKKNIANLGFHYYPDTLHYSEMDLSKWLIELNELGAAWLVIQSSLDRAIPEYFIRGLIRANIEPVIQILLPLPNPPEANELKPMPLYLMVLIRLVPGRPRRTVPRPVFTPG